LKEQNKEALRNISPEAIGDKEIKGWLHQITIEEAVEYFK